LRIRNTTNETLPRSYIELERLSGSFLFFGICLLYRLAGQEQQIRADYIIQSRWVNGNVRRLWKKIESLRSLDNLAVAIDTETKEPQTGFLQV